MSKNKKKQGVSPLSFQERCIIETRWCKDDKTVTAMAVELKRNKSSISRELGGKPRKGMGRYRASVAHAKATARIGKRGNIRKTERFPNLKTYIEDKMINEKWSPEQISIRLPLEYKKNEDMRIATETIYQEVYRRVRRGGNGAVKKGVVDLRPHLVRRHKKRARKGFRKAQKVEREASLPSIEHRPAVVTRRIQVGHWEDDTMVSKQSTSRLKTINERVSGVILISKMKDGSIVESNRCVTKKLSVIPETYRKTLTRDRGSENLGWKELETSLNMDIYFAHAYSSYERGSNENGNGLIRRQYPKKTDFAQVSEEDLHALERKLNRRPRKRHGGLTPEEVFFRATGVAIYS